MSNLSDGPDALDQLEALMRQLGAASSDHAWDRDLQQLADELPDVRARLAVVARMTDHAALKVLNLVAAAQPVCRSAAAEAQSLAERLDVLAGHAELGVGEARAALAEAAAALRHQSDVKQAQAEVLTDIVVAQDLQGLSGQVIMKLVRILGHAEPPLLQQLRPRSHGEPLLPPDTGRPAGPNLPVEAVGQDGVADLLASMRF